MKKLMLLFLSVALFQFPVIAEEFFGIGAELAQDTYNKKIIVVGLINNKPAMKAGIEPGDEIIAVDDEKITKKSICEVVSKIRGNNGSAVKIRIKKNFFIRKTYTLQREQVVLNCCQTAPYIAQWRQIADPEYINSKPIQKEALKKFSRKYQKTTALKIIYWQKRRQMFEQNYNACMKYSKNNQELCVIHLLDRESAKTNTDKMLYKFLQVTNY